MVDYLKAMEETEIKLKKTKNDEKQIKMKQNITLQDIIVRHSICCLSQMSNKRSCCSHDLGGSSQYSGVECGVGRGRFSLDRVLLT